jgi:hypothetical protein
MGMGYLHINCGAMKETLFVATQSALSMARLCKILAIKHVAEHFGLRWEAVKAIDQAVMEVELGEPDFSDVMILLIDEFALRNPLQMKGLKGRKTDQKDAE